MPIITNLSVIDERIELRIWGIGGGMSDIEDFQALFTLD